MRINAGIDEAGRGCIIGSLFIAGVTLNDYQVKELQQLGVKDSKLLSSKSRKKFYNIINNLVAEKCVYKIAPSQIDQYVKYKKLNYLTAINMAKILDKLQADHYYIDSSDVKPERFKATIIENSTKKVDITCRHHADSTFTVVAAASIIAKVKRDEEIEELKKKYGDFGSGYPSDKKTIKFLSNWVNEKKNIPKFARKSWKTWDKINTTLDSFV